MTQFIKLFAVAALAVWFNPCIKSQPLADGQSKFLGCAYSSTQSANFTKYWNQVTPENGGKWGSAEPNRDVMSWSAMDAAYNLAKTNGFEFKEHTLIWGNQAPGWMESLDTMQQREEIEEWFSLVASRYPEISYIDVVNEPLHAPPSGSGHGNYMNALGGSGSTGWDWVIRAFRLARHYFPNAKLLINEYSVTNSKASALAYIEIINLLKADSLIDGIGIQAHAFSTYGVSAEVTKSNLDLIGATGLPIYISELDIDGISDLEQMKEYKRVFPVFWEHPSVAGITLWGFRYGLWRTSQGAYLVTQTGAERPAFNWLKGYVKGTLVLSESVAVSDTDDNDTIFIDESLQMSAAVFPTNTTVPNISWSVSSTGIATINSKGLLTPVTTGKVTVKATTWDAGKSGTRIITIILHPVDSISLSALHDTITLQETLMLSAIVLPDASNHSLYLSVIPSGIAPISQSGVLTPVTTGTVTVIATANDGSGVVDSLSVVIVDPTATNDNQIFNTISVYPNPVTNGIVNITGIQDMDAIDVLDLQGHVISTVDFGGMDTAQINLSDYKGLLFIRIIKDKAVT